MGWVRTTHSTRSQARALVVFRTSSLKLTKNSMSVLSIIRATTLMTVVVFIEHASRHTELTTVTAKNILEIEVVHTQAFRCI
jgi:hypothetical protein